MIRFYLFLYLVFVVCGCGNNECYYNFFMNITDYDVDYDNLLFTGSGIQIDSSGYHVDLDALDTRILNIERCLINTSNVICPLSGEDANRFQCSGYNLNTEPFLRECMVIKIVKSVSSKCTPEEGFLPIGAPQELCDAKGLSRNSECPCRWRTAIQDNNILIVPYEKEVENLNLWDLVRMWSGCNMFWASKELAKCTKY